MVSQIRRRTKTDAPKGLGVWGWGSEAVEDSPSKCETKSPKNGATSAIEILLLLRKIDKLRRCEKAQRESSTRT